MKVNFSSDPNNTTQGYIALQFNRIKRLNPKFDYKVVSNFEEFDKKINEKQREKIITIAHGFRGKIALNSSVFNKDKSTEISYRNLNNDDQTPEQKERFKQTEMELLSCNTGEYIFGALNDSIAQNIQDHYGFKVTSAPNATIYNDGSISGDTWYGGTTKGEMVNFY